MKKKGRENYCKKKNGDRESDKNMNMKGGDLYCMFDQF